MDALNDLLLAPDGAVEKLAVMIIAILMFVAVMAMILFAIDPPGRPVEWVIYLVATIPATLFLLALLLQPLITRVQGVPEALEPPTLRRVVIFSALALLVLAVVAASVVGSIRRWRASDKVVFVAFAGPAIIGLIFGLLYPGIRTIYQSFLNRTGQEFVGIDNFERVFSEAGFQRVLLNTAIWVILVPIVSTFLGLIYAVLVDRSRFEAAAKALIFLPMAISLVGASIIWRFVYEYRGAGTEQVGILNAILDRFGVEPYQFLLTSPWNTLFLIVVFVWVQTGFAMTILSAAIKAIPDDIVEAARLDGASGTQMFFQVTIPAVRPALVVVLTTTAITTLKVFDIVRTMTAGNFNTSVVANEFYSQAFRQFDAGVGSALAVVLFVLVIPIVVYNIRQMRLSEDIR